jgi:hypothetical protein
MARQERMDIYPKGCVQLFLRTGGLLLCAGWRRGCKRSCDAGCCNGQQRNYGSFVFHTLTISAPTFCAYSVPYFK